MIDQLFMSQLKELSLKEQSPLQRAGLKLSKSRVTAKGNFKPDLLVVAKIGLVQILTTASTVGFASQTPFVTFQPQLGWMRPYPFFSGQPPFALDLEAPSRAYKKLREILSLTSINPGSMFYRKKTEANMINVELGSSPGGWTHVLMNLGATPLYCIDHSPPASSLAEKISQIPEKVKWIEANALTWEPEPNQPIDWVFCDLALMPSESLPLLAKWITKFNCHSFIWTVKLKGPTKEWQTVVEEIRSQLLTLLGPPRTLLELQSSPSATSAGWDYRILHTPNHGHEVAIVGSKIQNLATQ